jgi:hypothetical protein
VASLEGDHLVVYYYLIASEIWPDKEWWPLMGVVVDYCNLDKEVYFTSTICDDICLATF